MTKVKRVKSSRALHQPLPPNPLLFKIIAPMNQRVRSNFRAQFHAILKRNRVPFIRSAFLSSFRHTRHPRHCRVMRANKWNKSGLSLSPAPFLRSVCTTIIDVSTDWNNLRLNARNLNGKITKHSSELICECVRNIQTANYYTIFKLRKSKHNCRKYCKRDKVKSFERKRNVIGLKIIKRNRLIANYIISNKIKILLKKTAKDICGIF